MSVKQVLVVRKDLKMGPGKIGAQCAHASLKVFFDRGKFFGSGRKQSFNILFWKDAYTWYNESYAKICLRVDSEDELIDMYNQAVRANIPCSLITDSGRTEFHGVPTKTVVAIGPFNSNSIDRITGKLRLL